MIRLALIGEREAVARLRAMPVSLHRILVRRMWDLVQKLKARVQRKLSGDVLNVITGALRRSIQPDVNESGQTVIGRVFSSGDVKYARIHEMGGTTRAHVIEPRKAAMLSFMMGGSRVFAKRVNHPGSKMPARSFMRTSLAEMRGEIIKSISAGIVEAARSGPAQ